jgi:hypothetical protein
MTLRLDPSNCCQCVQQLEMGLSWVEFRGHAIEYIRKVFLVMRIERQTTSSSE